MVSMLLGLLGLSTRKDSRADHTRPICPRRETSFVDAHVEREKRRGERARQHGFQISTEPLSLKKLPACQCQHCAYLFRAAWQCFWASLVICVRGRKKKRNLLFRIS
jgi:hypothetical protein